MRKIVILALSFAATVASASSANVQAYAYSQGGESSCSTWGPTAHMVNDYPGGQSGKFYLGQPTGPGLCNVQQSMDFSSGAAAPVTATSSVNASGIGPNGAGTYIGNSAASGAYGKLGVGAHGTYNGLIDTFATLGSESFATFTESFLILSPGANGQSGIFTPTFTVGGSWGVSGRTAAQFEMDYQVGNQPNLILYRIQGDQGQQPSIYYNGYVASLPGLTVGPTSVSGTTPISFSVPFIYSQAFNMTISLYSSVIPSSNGGGVSSGDVDFAHTATLTGIDVQQNGQSVPFTIQSGSGTVYTANGVQSAVPEPSTLVLLFAGLGAICASAARRALL